MDGILVVDDDPALLRVAERVLRNHAPVLTATEPNAAREISRDRRPELAIVDLVLADSGGVDLIARRPEEHLDGKPRPGICVDCADKMYPETLFRKWTSEDMKL